MESLATAPQQRADVVFEVMKTRRVVRRFSEEPVAEEQIRRVLEAGRWATTGGNRRIHRYLVIRDPKTIRLAKMISPGMLGAPPVLIFICIDRELQEQQGTPERHASGTIDVGTQAMNMMVMAHALGLGACPVTSFSQSGMSTLLDLPPSVTPVLMVLLGHPGPHKRVMRAGAPTRVTVDDLTFWEHYGQKSAI